MNPFEAVVAAVGHHSRRSEWARRNHMMTERLVNPTRNSGKTRSKHLAMAAGMRTWNKSSHKDHKVMLHLPDSGTLVSTALHSTAPRYHLLFLGWGTS